MKVELPQLHGFGLGVKGPLTHGVDSIGYFTGKPKPAMPSFGIIFKAMGIIDRYTCLLLAETTSDIDPAVWTLEQGKLNNVLVPVSPIGSLSEDSLPSCGWSVGAKLINKKKQVKEPRETFRDVYKLDYTVY